MATQLPDFDDRTRWVKVEDVNVFGEHTARHPSTGKFFKVDKVRLEKIAERSNARDAKRQLCVLFPGHTLADERDADGKITRKIPERDQPEVLGYARAFKVAFDEDVGTHVIRACYYLPADREAEARSYPRVSAEFYADDDEIDAIALLRRAPKLDLGQWTYDRGDRVCIRYEMESNMGFPGNDSGGPAAPPSAGAPDMAFKEQLMAALKEILPQMLQELAMAQQPPAPPPGAAPPGAAPPPPPGGAGDAMRMQREQGEILASRYQRERDETKALVKALEERLAATEERERASRYERDLTHKLAQGYDFDLPEQMNYVRDMDDTRYAAYSKVFFGPKGCAKAPISTPDSPMIATADGAAGRTRGKEPEFTEGHLKVALQYQRESKCNWTDARDYAVKNYKA